MSKFEDERMRSLGKRLREVYAQAEKELTEKVDSFFADFEEADERKKRLVDKGELSEQVYTEWRKNKLLMGQKYKDLRDTMAGRLLDANRIAARYINGELPGLYAHNYNEVGTDVARKVKGFSFDLVDERTVRKLSTDNKTLLPYKTVDGRRDVRWNTKKVNAQMLQGILHGESAKKIAKRLQRVTEMNKESAMRNARTAFTSAQNKGRIDAMEKLADDGVILKKEWIAARDSRTRHAHLELNRTQVDIDKPFENSIGRIMYPGDPNAHPSNVYNCRCTIAQVFLGFKEPPHKIAEGTDITDTWERRESEFDFEIEDVINAQGFDGKPRIVDADEFDKFVKQANNGEGFIAQRSYSAPNQETLDAYREQLYSGKWYVDCSTGGAQYGQGMYCAADYTGTLSDGIKAEMDHYRELGEGRFSQSQAQYAQQLYQEEMDKVAVPFDAKYKQAFTDEVGVTDLWTKGSKEREYIKQWIAENPEEAQKLKAAYQKAQMIGEQKGMAIERLTKEEFKQKYPNLVARSYTETFTLDPSAKVITFNDLLDTKQRLRDEFAARDIDKILSEQLSLADLGNNKNAITYMRFQLGRGDVDCEVAQAARSALSEDERFSIGALIFQAKDEVAKSVDRLELEYAKRFGEMDNGSFAALLGYDAINAGGHGQSGSYTVILNRTKLIIRRPK